MTVIQPTISREFLVRQFERSGADGVIVRVFERLDPSIANWLMDVAVCRSPEEPVLGGRWSTERWLLLTTKRVLSCQGTASPLVLPFGDLKRVTVDVGEAVRSRTAKSLWETLDVTTVDGVVHQVRCEAGPPFSGLWNLLKWIADVGRRRSGAHSR